MIDFHCHLDLYPEPREVIAEAVRRGCYVLAVTTTPLAWDGTAKLINNSPRIQIGLGLHPELVAERAQEVGRLCQLVPEARYIGEIGLDGSASHRPSFAIQVDVFRTILGAVASHGGRVMSIHSRGAATETLNELERHSGAGIPVLHWFSGTHKELQRAIALDCWFSVGPAMLRGEKGRNLVALMPPHRVLTETDGPFARRGRRPLLPWDAAEAEGALAKAWGTDETATQEQLKENLRVLVQRTRC